MITLWDEDLYWQELLRQEGISFRTGPRLSGRDVVVLNREPAESHVHRVWQHIQSGGGLLAAGVNAAAVWLELEPSVKRLRWLAPDNDSPLFRNVGIVDTETRGTLLPGANAGVTDSGATAILATPAGRGFCILLPFEVHEVLSNTASGPKQFPANTPRFPHETVARVSRGEVRRLIANCLRFLLARKGLPYVHLAATPGPTLSTFAFRVDADFVPRRDIEAVVRFADRVGMKFSWYVNVAVHAAYLDLFADLARQGHDIQLHCQRHIVYPDYQRNLDNFRLGKETMADAGISPVGAAGPYGEWNLNLNRAFEELGFEYSSEFCLAHDDLPFRPVVGGRLSTVLQVPVHPICLGRLAAARATPKQMTAYFRSVIDLQVARREPCFLYDHPERIDQFSDLLADVLGYAKERCGSVTTITQFVRWWQRRERLKWSSRITDTGLEIEAEPGAESISIVAEKDGSFALLPAASHRHQLDAAKWQPGPERVRFDPASLAARKPSLMLQARSLRRRARKNLRGHHG